LPGRFSIFSKLAIVVLTRRFGQSVRREKSLSPIRALKDSSHSLFPAPATPSLSYPHSPLICARSLSTDKEFLSEFGRTFSFPSPPSSAPIAPVGETTRWSTFRPGKEDHGSWLSPLLRCLSSFPSAIPPFPRRADRPSSRYKEFCDRRLNLRRNGAS